MSIPYANRDEELLIGLTHCYRCISANLASFYFQPKNPRSDNNAARWLARLERLRLLESRLVFAKSLPQLTSPLLRWSPGEPLPEFGPVSYTLKHRFQTAARATRIYIAARAAAKRYGGSAERWPRRSESSHDLGLAQVYLDLAVNQPHRAEGWQSEAYLISQGVRAGNKLPDAMVTELDGSETVIEFGGEYGKKKLTEFHADCERRNRGYELW